MKLSIVKKQAIQNDILEIFTKPNNKRKAEENQIVVDTYMQWIPQYQKYIDKLPIEFLHTDKSIHIDIMSVTDPDQRLARWYGELPDRMPVLKTGSGYYADTQAIPIADSMLDRINALLLKIEQLSLEKRELRTFIEECLEKVNTTKQLRELWADYPALAKHIPPEPVRAKKHAQQVLDLESSLDVNAINKRLTENLLEG